ncbi:iron(III) transport system ATP-binding protein [Melghirimyces profundicolus]|uniref:Spermidine/putrescine import ATP-binding protein PotA n=1 Tax=Melghirimyces profundicolus TaxID=1242148 RepID=A0A2T6C8I0_9BACL|nr:ABC transporter ATP-binding protein [Melghirimyces profundicolus]PTX64620.1 iron(III) transport system ATP-binding protein [Melghirimyces profundicolus]
MSRVRLQNVSKTFGTTTAVKELNLTIREGEFFTFLGPSGCGKTTTLRMIAGFYYPAEGRIWFDNRDVTEVPPQKRNTGMVFQNYALFPHMTVHENVAFGLEVRKISKKEIRERVKKALEQVRLAGYSDRRIAQLSGGQQQRVALARSLVIRPGILLLDEPLSNLDARLRDEMRSEILSLQRSLGITTIYVTHDQTEALSMSDRIAVFNQGVCQQVGTPEEVYNAPRNAFVASFVGETNLFPATVAQVSGETVTVQSKDHTFRIRHKQEESGFSVEPGNRLFLTIRPEGVDLVPEAGENTLSAKMELVQFMGTSFHCAARLEDGTPLKAMFVNRPDLMGRLREGDRVIFRFPEDRLRLIPGGDDRA